MRKTFASNLIILLAVNLLVKPFYVLFIELEIQNRSGAEAYGTYFALLNLTFLFNMLLDMGTTNWNTREVAQNTNAQHAAQGSIVTLRFLLALLYGFVCLLTGFILGYTSSFFGLLFLLTLGQIFLSGILFLRSYLTGMHLFRIDSFVSVLDKALLAFIMGLLLLSHSGTFPIVWLGFGQAIAYGITFIVALVLVVKNGHSFSFQFSPSTSFAVLKKSLPFALLFFVSMAAMRLDSILLEQLVSAEEAGIYAMSFRFFDAFNMISYLFAVILLPMFTRLLHEKKPIESILHVSLQWMWFGGFLMVLFAFNWGESILYFFYDRFQHEAYAALPALMVGCCAFSLQYIFGTLLTANGNLKALIQIALAGVLVNVIINLLFIPTYGFVTAAYANAATQSIMLFLQIWRVRAFMHTRLFLSVKKIVLFSFSVIAVTVALNHFLPPVPNNVKENAFAIGLFLAFSLVAAAATRLLDVKKFIDLLRREK
jgi:O-antigen/teichoic acid export membrane protein